MLRGAAAAWLGLITLQALTTDKGAGTVGGLVGTLDGLVKRALDPTVAAIPDHSTDAGSVKDKDGNVHPKIPGYLGGGVVPGPGTLPPGTKKNPDYKVIDPPDPRNPQYDNPDPSKPGGIPMTYIPWPSVPGLTTA